MKSKKQRIVVGLLVSVFALMLPVGSTRAQTGPLPKNKAPKLANVTVNVSMQGISETSCWNGRAQHYSAQMQDTVTGLDYSADAILDPCGYFIAYLPDPYPDNYHIYHFWLKTDKTLAVRHDIVVYSDPTAYTYTLPRTGDASKDNVITVVDENEVKVSFGKPCGDPLYNYDTDFDQSCSVNIVDWNYVKSNFGRAGEAPLW